MGVCHQICVGGIDNKQEFETPLISFKKDNDSPLTTYATYSGSHHHETPCQVNHILDNFLKISFKEGQSRGKLLEGYYFIIPYEIFYNGEWKLGHPHGFGEVIFKDGSVLYGWFKDGVCEGPDCLYVRSDGCYYRGSIMNNLFNGKGVLTKKQCYIYDGQWLNNLPNGKGKQTFLETGDSYEGKFINGVKEDTNATYKWGKSSTQFEKYQGSFANNKIWKRGTLFKKNGDVIIGQFNNRNVLKAYIKNQQRQIQGQIVNGVLSGQGIIKYKDGRIYNGSFKDGQPHGQGALSDTLGQHKGFWFKGKKLLKHQGLQDAKIQYCIEKIENCLKINKYSQEAFEAKSHQQQIQQQIQTGGYVVTLSSKNQLFQVYDDKCGEICCYNI